MEKDRALAKEEAASLLGLSPKTLGDKRWRVRVGLYGVKIGRRLRFIENDLEALVQRGREPISQTSEQLKQRKTQP